MNTSHSLPLAHRLAFVSLTPALSMGLVFGLVSLPISTQATFHQTDTAALVQGSEAVFRGTVVGSSCFKADGGIYTRTSLRVNEALKGVFPPIVQVTHRGGQVQQEDEFAGESPRFMPEGEYLMFVIRGPGGKLECTRGAASAIRLQRLAAPPPAYAAPGQNFLDETRAIAAGGTLPGADVRDQAGSAGMEKLAPVGMLGGTPARYLPPDMGEAIRYYVDADSLPAGITLSQATNAVQQALEAWAAVTGLQFRLAAVQSFGQGADTLSVNNEAIWVQLHDNYNRVSGYSTLGIGGRVAVTSPLAPAGWNIGGNVAGTEFLKIGRGYVVLEATNTIMQTLSTFTEVLCHELGHALNLAHSSEVPTGDPVLNQAMMYFQAHADGRGATLGVYDPPIIQQIYPSNSPPFAFNRMIDAVTASPQPSVPGINEVALGYDLQGGPLTAVITNINAMYGTFTVVGTKIQYTPTIQYDSPRTDPSGNSFWALAYARVSDGTNASPYVRVKVLSMRDDGDSPSDGLPDYWMIAFFGHAAPSAADHSRAIDDADGDGLNNLQEYIAGSHPVNAASAQRITSFTPGTLQFQAKPYELFELQGTTNMTTWTTVSVPFVPTNAPTEVLLEPSTNAIALVTNTPASGNHLFLRIRKVP